MSQDLELPQWVRLVGGAFSAGSDVFYPEEAPARNAHVAAFSLTAAPITNRQYAAFVKATGYVTIAERPLSRVEFPHLTELDRTPGSLVFTPSRGPVDLRDPQQWWKWVPGASWRRPSGAPRDFEASADHPVVQIAYADAVAYADWVGGRLPTEDEFEFAACGGRRPDPYAWGPTRDLDDRVMANTWRGSFPYRNEGANGWIGTSPVGTFPPNGFGLVDCIGNVWEWTSDIYDSAGRGLNDADKRGRAAVDRPQDPELTPAARIAQRVIKGGSHLCAPEYSLRYRPAARAAQAEDSATTHIGFRVAKDAG